MLQFILGSVYGLFIFLLGAYLSRFISGSKEDSDVIAKIRRKPGANSVPLSQVFGTKSKDRPKSGAVKVMPHTEQEKEQSVPVKTQQKLVNEM